MIDQRLTPASLSKKLSVSAEAISKWLLGETYPNAPILVKLLLLARKDQYELAESFAYIRYCKIYEMTKATNPKPYDFKEAFEKIIADALMSNKLSDEEITNLYRLFDKVSKFISVPNVSSIIDETFESHTYSLDRLGKIPK